MKREPQWKRRRCPACGKVKKRDQFANGWKRRCMACSLCHGGCGRVLDYVALKGRKTCSDECYERVRAASIEKMHQGREAKRQLPTRRWCSSCQMVKPISEYCVIKRDPVTKEIRRYAFICKPCKRAYQREKYASDPANRERALARARAARDRNLARMAKDPEFAAEMADRKRRYNENRKYGRPDGRRVLEKPLRGPKAAMPRLPAAPLAHLVERIVMREQARLENFETAEQAKTSRDKICKNLGCDARDLYAWSHGERDTVQFDVADRVLLATGLNWWDVWEEDELPAQLREA